MEERSTTASPLLPTADTSTLDPLLQKAKQLAIDLATRQPRHRVADIPSARGTSRFESHPHYPPHRLGVYCIRHNRHGTLYVGSGILRKRICDNHVSHRTGNKGFQADLRREFELKPDVVRAFLKENCDISWVPIDGDDEHRQKDLMLLVEYLVIAWMRPNNPRLLNGYGGRKEAKL